MATAAAKQFMKLMREPIGVTLHAVQTIVIQSCGLMVISRHTVFFVYFIDLLYEPLFAERFLRIATDECAHT